MVLDGLHCHIVKEFKSKAYEVKHLVGLFLGCFCKTIDLIISELVIGDTMSQFDTY